MSYFSKLNNGKVLFVDKIGNKYYFIPTLNILPHPAYVNNILIAHQSTATKIHNATSFDWRDITFPVANSRNEMIDKLNQDFFFNDLEIRLQKLENYEFVVELSTNIGQAQSGTITFPENSYLKEKAYPDNDPLAEDEDGLVLTTDESGKASSFPARNASNDLVLIDSFNPDGSYTLTGAPKAPSTLVFAVKYKFKHWQHIDAWSEIAGNNIRSLASFVAETDGGILQNKESILLHATRDKKVTNSYLVSNEVFTNITPFVVPYAGYIMTISAITENQNTWDAEIHRNNQLIAGASLSLNNERKKTGNFNIPVSINDEISMYCKGVNIQKPRIQILIIKS